MRATPFCLEIIDKCQQLLLDVDDIQRAARIYQNLEAGEINIGVGGGVRELVLRKSIPEFVSQHPHIGITVVEDTAAEAASKLKQRKVELLIAGLGSFRNESEFQSELIANVPLFAFVRSGHPLRSQKNISFGQLARYPLVSPTILGPTHPLLNAILNSGSEITKPHITCSDYPTLKNVLLGSDACLISAELNCESEVRQGMLVKLDFAHPALNTELGIIQLGKRSRSPAAQKYIDILTE